MTNVRAPVSATVADTTALLTLLRSMYEAIVELQGLAATVTPATLAAKAGAARVVYIPGATVTDPATGQTFAANVYATAVAV